MDEEIRWLPHPISLNSFGEIFVTEYRRRRYLERLTDSELDARMADIVSNLLALGDDGKYRPRFNVRDGVYKPIRNLDFLRMATDAWEEARLRHTEVREPLSAAHLQIAKRLSDESWCRRPDWISDSRLSLDKYERPRMLFKFGEAKWNRELVRRGSIHISPASSYDDDVKINAIRDNELRLEWYDASLALRALEAPDYLCFCLSSEYDYRLFVDFKYDSCVAIKDPAVFSERLRHAIASHNAVHRGSRVARLTECPVIYVDPFALLQPEEAIEVQFCKHFRFAYQTEFRFALAAAGQRRLEPIDLNLGPMHDIAEIVIDPRSTAS